MADFDRQPFVKAPIVTPKDIEKLPPALAWPFPLTLDDLKFLRRMRVKADA